MTTALVRFVKSPCITPKELYQESSNLPNVRSSTARISRLTALTIASSCLGLQHAINEAFAVNIRVVRQLELALMNQTRNVIDLRMDRRLRSVLVAIARIVHLQ